MCRIKVFFLFFHRLSFDRSAHQPHGVGKERTARSGLSVCVVFKGEKVREFWLLFPLLTNALKLSNQPTNHREEALESKRLTLLFRKEEARRLSCDDVGTIITTKSDRLFR